MQKISFEIGSEQIPGKMLRIFGDDLAMLPAVAIKVTDGIRIYNIAFAKSNYDYQYKDWRGTVYIVRELDSLEITNRDGRTIPSSAQFVGYSPASGTIIFPDEKYLSSEEEEFDTLELTRIAIDKTDPIIGAIETLTLV